MKRNLVAVIFAMTIASPAWTHIPTECEELEERRRLEEASIKMQEFFLEITKKQTMDRDFSAGEDELNKFIEIYIRQMLELGTILDCIDEGMPDR